MVATVIETFATVVLLILLILWISHLLNGDATVWVRSKFQIAAATPSSSSSTSTGGSTSGGTDASGGGAGGSF